MIGPSMSAAFHLRTAVTACAAFALCACAPAPSPPRTTTAPDAWHVFTGSWNAVGTRHSLMLDGERRAAILDLRGPMLLAGPARPGVGFYSQTIALTDTAVGLEGRSVWVDDAGDKVFSEIKGSGTREGNRIHGRIVGGTGRYAGAEGTYEFSWQYVLEIEDGVIQGRAIGLEGQVRVAAEAPH
jgi:hypothetical protein